MTAGALALCLVVGIGGCAKANAVDRDGGGSGSGTVDAKVADAPLDPTHDGPRADAASGPHATHLLLSEVVLTPSAGEFIEVVNPTSSAIDLTRYFLSDNGNYWKLPQGMTTTDPGDFIAKFPTGASIPAHGVVTVALGSAADFLGVYSANPTYAIGSNPPTMNLLVSNATPTLTNEGEVVVLFQWDVNGTIVHDVDMILVGTPTAANGLVSKAGAGYKADAMTLANQISAPGMDQSTKRVALEAGHETDAGNGNGITGDDETSEATGATWDSAFTLPTPGVVPTALLP